MRYFREMICALNRGILLKKHRVSCKLTKYNMKVLQSLKREGYIHGYSFCDKKISIFLKYDDIGNSLMRGIVSMSNPSRRILLNLQQLNRYAYSSREFFLSTSKGILSIRRALNYRVGGVLLLNVVI